MAQVKNYSYDEIQKFAAERGARAASRDEVAMARMAFERSAESFGGKRGRKKGRKTI